MQKLFFLSLLILTVLVSNVFAAKYYQKDQNTFKDSRNFNVMHFSDGTVEIAGKRIGFSITNTVLEITAITTTKDFLWTWTYDENEKKDRYQLQATNNNVLFSLVQDWNFTNKPKLTFTIKNRLASISNATFWFIIFLDKDDKIKYANEEINARNQIRVFDVNAIKGFTMRPEINDKFGFDFQDVIENGFVLTGVKIKDGTEFGYSNQTVLALGFQKNSGSFPINSTITIDPTIVNTGFVFPKTSGILTKNQYNQWINGNALLADDTNYSSIGANGQRQTVGDFDFNINSEWAIRSINIQGNGNCGAPSGCTAIIKATITDDNGDSYGAYRSATWTCPASTICSDSTKTFSFPVDNFNYPHNFKKISLSNGKFMIDLNCTSGCTTMSLDYVSVSIDYIDGVDQNVTTHEDPTENVFHLTIADTNTQTINWDSTVFYSNFNAKLDTNGVGTYTFDFSRNQAETKLNNVGFGIGQWVSNGCWMGTACFSFQPDPDVGGDGAELRSEIIIDHDVNQSLSIVAQVNPDANLTSTNPFGDIVSYAVSSTNLSYILSTRLKASPTATIARFQIATGNPAIITTCELTTKSSILYPNRWTQLAGTYDGANMRLYQDGVLTKTCAKTGQIYQTMGTTKFAIGRTDTNYFYGKIDEVLVLDTNLSAQQITDLNNSGHNIFYQTGIKDFNSNSIVAPKNNIDVFDTNANAPSDSNVSIRIGDKNGTYIFGTNYPYTSIFSGTDANFGNMRVKESTNFAIRFDLNAGGSDTNNFFTPIVDTNFIIKQGNIPCNPLWDADFNISCNSGCTINDGNIDLNKNKFVLNNSLGAGTITLIGTIFNVTPYYNGIKMVDQNCRVVGTANAKITTGG